MRGLFHSLKSVTLVLLFSAALATFSSATNFTVTNVNDSGTGSLRQAILNSFASTATDTHYVVFSIGTGSKTINLTSPLPIISENITIDGRTQPGFSGAPLIEINGASAGAGACGFNAQQGSLSLYSVIINRFSSDGVRVGGTSAGTEGSAFVYGCWIGVNQFGNLSSPNGGHGVNILRSSNAYSNQIGAAGANNLNVISGNAGSGIYVDPSIRAAVYIYNNLIGLGANGTSNCGNAGSGIRAAPYSNIINEGVFQTELHYYGMFIGSEIAGTGNVISWNGSNGITIPSTGPIGSGLIPIFRNMIGTDQNGIQDCGNAGNGIGIGTGNKCWVGRAGAGNVISGNSLCGIRMSTGEEIYLEENFIGTNSVAGVLGNGENGLQFDSVNKITVRNCTIGNNTLRGAYIEGTSNNCKFYGNRIGTNSFGTNAGNGSDGVCVAADVPDSLLFFGTRGFMGPGGNPALPGNKVAFNGGAGVRIISPTRLFEITGNEIWSNVGLGIDLGTTGVTPNDLGDTDTGPNELQNFPVLTVATPTRVAGTLNSQPDITYKVEIYLSTPHSSGYGQGRSLLATTYVTTDANGNGNFVKTGLSLTPGTQLTAIAAPFTYIDPVFGLSDAFQFTSEFSQNITVSGSETGDFGLASASLSVSESVGSVAIIVNRTGGSFGAASVDYTITPGTATAGYDYSGLSGTVSFPSGHTSKTIVIPILEDTLDENAETFTVTLSTPVGGPLITGIPTASVTIDDNDNPPVLSIANASLIEGNSGTSLMTFTASLSTASGLPVSANWATTEQSANQFVDFTPGNGTINFAPGETQKSITVAIIGETTVETNESFLVTLVLPVNATLGAASAVGTIIDDDSPGTLQFASSSHSAQETEETTSLFISRTGGTNGIVSVHYTVTGGTATAGDDYPFSTLSGNVTFANGQSSQVISFGLLDDVLIEGNETVVVTLSAPTGGASLGRLIATTLTIIDNDTVPSISGRVLDENGVGVSGATVILSGDKSDSVQTDAGGNYSFTDLAVAGNYLVEVSQSGKVFLPANRQYTNLANSLIDEDFTAYPLVIPELHLIHNGDQTVTLYWRLDAIGWSLERNDEGLAASGWNPVLDAPVPSGPWNFITLPATADSVFFRLKKP